MLGNDLQKPCLIETRQGFSVLYNNRLLYSKYNPSGAILKIVNQLELQENTLILCYSPVLFYGFTEILNKLKNNCFVLAIECNKDLYDFSLQYIPKNDKRNYSYIYCNSIYDFSKVFDEEKLFSISNFKRCITIDFSAGVQLYEIQYKNYTKLADDFINTFWKNRITLVKMGRLYAKNIFKNLCFNAKSKLLEKNSIDIPILVFGAGTSLDNIIPKIKEESDRFFILSVDAATIPLLKHGIIPDRIVVVESQLANEKAFIGLKNSHIPLIADLTSRTNILNITNGDNYFFLSEYAKTNFINRLKKSGLVNLSIPPLGSVGLAAIEIALFLRKDVNIPIFFAGLDFCFEVGKTHCKEAPHIQTLLNNNTKINYLENISSSFKRDCFFLQGKDGNQKITDTPLFNYAKLFSARYSMQKNIYDVGAIGIDIGSRYLTCEEMLEHCRNYKTNKELNELMINKTKDNFNKEKTSFNNNEFDIVKKTKDFYNEELNALMKIKDILTGKIIDTDNELKSLLTQREYLYLHFPDAHTNQITSESFLKRVRAELDFFIKDIQTSLRLF